MPALLPTDYYATVTWLGYVPRFPEDRTIETVAVSAMPLDFAGHAPDVHAGLTRASCSRVTQQHPRGTDIRNVRQLSILSAEELALIAEKLDLPSIDPTWVGASIILSGIPDFTHVPPSSRLQAENGTTLVVDMENRPCHIVSRTIEADRPGHGKGFKTAANGRRGVTAWVERPGLLEIGTRLRLHVPDQRAWAP